MKKHFQPAQLATTIALVMAAPIALAQAESVVTLDPIVITATKAEEKASQVPARITVIDQQQISQNPALNLSDVLQKDASIYVKQYGGIGQGTTIALRALDPKHTLLTRDGSRLNTPNTLTPVYPETLDLVDIERVEILKGPASVQYGTDAIGGVINMVSQTPKKTGGFVTGIYGENDTYKAIVGGDFVADNGLYAQLRGQRMETDGTRIFNDQEKKSKSGYDQKGYSAKVGYSTDDIQASVNIAHNEGINEYIASSKPAQRQFENRTILAKALGKITDTITLAGHYANIKDNQTYVEESRSNFITENNEYDLHARWNVTDKQNILLGTTYIDTEYQDAYAYKGVKDITSKGYYAQHQYNGNKLNTQVGVRVEDNERYGSHTVGQGAVRYHFTPATSVYANIGSAFRAPSLNELYYNSSSSYWGTTYITSGNENLKPEESVSYELGLDHKFTPYLAASLTGYRTEVKNLIGTQSIVDTVNSVTTSTYHNTNKATFTGGEVGVKWAKDALFASAHYAYVKSENKANGLEIAYRPRQTGTLVLGYDDGKYGVNTALTARSTANASNSANSVKVPGYATVDVNAHWNVNPYVKVFANLQNIGDVNYPVVWNFGNWYVNGGRQANVGVTFKY